MPRVLHITEVPELGILSVLKEFTREQVSRGDEVHILAARKMRRLPGVQHHDWSIKRRRPSSYVPGVAELRRTIQDVDPDVIHLHSFFAGFFGRLPFVLSGLTVPVVYQPHAWSFDVLGNPHVATALRLWERFASCRTNVLVANCADEIDEGRHIGIDNHAITIGVPIDTDRFAPVDEATRQHYRVKLGVGKPAMLLCLGRLARQKGQDQLAAAWEKSPIPDTELIFVGPTDHSDLRASAPQEWGHSIRAVGQQADVRPWLWACDGLLLPSRYETVSLAVAEAMACGRPAVATRVNGVQEILTGGSQPPAGTVVPLGDMAQLLLESQRLVSDPALMQRQGEAGRIRALESFSVPVIVDRLERAYQEAMKVTRGGHDGS